MLLPSLPQRQALRLPEENINIRHQRQLDDRQLSVEAATLPGRRVSRRPSTDGGSAPSTTLSLTITTTVVVTISHRQGGDGGRASAAGHWTDTGQTLNRHWTDSSSSLPASAERFKL